MELNAYFKSLVDQDRAAVVICDLEHTILYMNPAAIASYAKHGGAALLGKSVLPQSAVPPDHPAGHRLVCRRQKSQPCLHLPRQEMNKSENPDESSLFGMLSPELTTILLP